VPALDPVHRVRVTATPLDVEALAMTFRRSPAWETDVFPIEYVDPATGARAATWPERFSLDWIDTQKQTYLEAGKATEYQREYMCEPVDPTTKTFTQSMIRVEPVVRTWHPVYAMYDPARTTRATSDRTGKAVWSWIGNRLIIWDGAAELWKPDEIINDIFKTDTEYSPVVVGVEEDGLNEFLLQPLRTEQARRGHAVPIRPLRAPRGKMDFIKALQPYFNAGEVVFAKPMPGVVQQLLAFPTGKIDFINALAYSLTLQPGVPLYEFSLKHITQPRPIWHDSTLYLAINGTAAATSAILLQLRNGALHIHADWMREGDPGQSLPDILQQAQVEAGRPMTLVAPPQHFLGFDTVGLRAACTKIPVNVKKGGALHVGREELRAMMKRQVGEFSALQVSDTAKWTLRALSGGYARAREKGGAVSDFAADNAYKVLCEGLETFAAMTRLETGDDNQRNYAYTENGQRYLTARP
jgi:phage terminase large subunit-like protein